MWYDSFMPQVLPEHEVDAAWSAVSYAQKVRNVHRRRTERGDRQREKDIAMAMDRIRDCMTPLRSMIGKFPYGPQTDQAERNRQKIYAASNALQKERRKLWKMAAHD